MVEKARSVNEKKIYFKIFEIKFLKENVMILA